MSIASEKEIKKNKQAEEFSEEDNQSVQIIVFKLANGEYALKIDQIKEVVITPNIAKVPLVPSYIKGVANIRGNILAIVDLEEKFGLTELGNAEKDKKGYYSLVVESDTLNMAILVKEVPNTLTVKHGDIDHSPDLIESQAGDKKYINGIVKLEDRIVILIDIYSVIDKSEIAKIT